MWRPIETGTLKGVVTDTTGRPIRGALIETFLGLGQPQPASRLTYGNGAFEFESLLVGSHFVRISAKGFMPGTQDVNIASGQTTVITVNLQKGDCELTGRVTEDGKRPVKADVSLLSRGILVQRTATGKTNGTFRFRNLTDGRYEVQVTSACHASRGWTGDVHGTTRVDLELPVVEGCVSLGKCDVCGKTKEVRFCKYCHAYICDECRHNYPARLKAMIRRRLRREGKVSEYDVEAAYQRELDLRKREPCPGC